MIESNNIQFITEDGAINTVTGDKRMFGLYAWMYEQEAQNTSCRIKITCETKAKKGLFIGSIPPYGYRKEAGRLYIREDESHKW